MIQQERLLYLIRYLMEESPGYQWMEVPDTDTERRLLLRSLMNVRPPCPVQEEFLAVQDEYLRCETEKKGITEWRKLSPAEPGIYLWQGDITTLRADAIVNAANSQLLGCFCPCHGCIDNAIHTYAGVQLRLACAELMERQGREEETGKAKITPGFNLPCSYVIHTVGPVIRNEPTEKDCEQLASCYRSCLEAADAKRLRSIAFCCISTGEFHFPNETAAQIAVRTVREYRKSSGSRIEVIFNVFKENDGRIYGELLG